MSDYFKATYDGRVISFGGWDGYVAMPPSYRTLTLQTDGHGTLTATTLTGLPGDTVTLTPTYNTYYRFNNYSVTGGTIAGNTFTFGNEDATAQANFNPNYFTASGAWEKGSNTSAKLGSVNLSIKYATASYKTSNVPAAWYSTSNRWKPNGASAYKITLNPRIGLSAKNTMTNNQTYSWTLKTMIGNTANASQTYSNTLAGTKVERTVYSKTVTSDVQNVNYGVSGTLTYSKGRLYYFPSANSGTWTATGIAP